MVRKIPVIIISAVFLCGVLITAGCVSEQPAKDNPLPLIGAWIFEKDKSVTLIFDSEGNCGGKAPINSFGGMYSVDGNKLMFSDFFRTLMAGEPERMAAEDEFFANLSKIASYETDSVENPKNLELLDADGTVLLTFVREELKSTSPETAEKCTLPSGTWALEENGYFTITFNPDGTYKGNGSVNEYGGIYMVYCPASKPFGESIDLTTDAYRTKRGGPLDELTAEDKYMESLLSAAEYSFVMENNVISKLQLLDREGNMLLTFVKAPE